MYFFGAEVGFALLILFIKINFSAFTLKAKNITCSKGITILTVKQHGEIYVTVLDTLCCILEMYEK
jgi:hypothetical protein